MLPLLDIALNSVLIGVIFLSISEAAKPAAILSQMIAEAREIRGKLHLSMTNEEIRRNHLNLVHTLSFSCQIMYFVYDINILMVLKLEENGSRTLVHSESDSDKTLVPEMMKSHTMNVKINTLTEDMNTMVINNDEGDDDDATMKSSTCFFKFLFFPPVLTRIFNLLSSVSGHDTGSADFVKDYRPLFLDHFDRKEMENNHKVPSLCFS